MVLGVIGDHLLPGIPLVDSAQNIRGGTMGQMKDVVSGDRLAQTTIKRVVKSLKKSVQSADTILTLPGLRAKTSRYPALVARYCTRREPAGKVYAESRVGTFLPGFRSFYALPSISRWPLNRLSRCHRSGLAVLPRLATMPPSESWVRA